MSAAPLEALAAAADLVDTQGDEGAGPVAAPPAAPQESPNFGAIAFILAGFREVSCVVLAAESPRRTLADPNIERCARALAPVADKYGLQLDQYMSGPEGMACLVAGPILWAAWRELDAELRAKNRAAKARQVADDTPPAAAPAPAPQAPAPGGQ